MVLAAYERVVIVDLDGTLSDYSHRVKLIKERKYDEFNREGLKDKPIQNICNLVRHLGTDGETKIVVMTARDESVRHETQQWLHVNEIPCDELLMRKEGDNRHDHEVKFDLYQENFEFEDIWLILEDRKSVVDMWRGEGLTCLEVAEGGY
jgi:uncharacterized HAD superfamily protein